MISRAFIALLAVAGNVPVAAAQTAGQTVDQTPAPAADANRQADADPDEIIVTAQKRSERLLDVPLSISAVSGDQLVKAGINSTLDLQQVAPGIMTVTNGIGFIPSIRGVQSSGTSPGDTANVAIYLDDVAINSPLAGYFDLADIERIEVLKGPQGTLFGRNATGGAIRIITRRPSFTTQGNFSLDYGLRYQEARLGGYVSGPVTDWIAASLSASYRKGGSFIKGIGPNEGREYGGRDDYLVRGKLLLQPADSLEIILAADVSKSKNDVAFSTGVEGNANPSPGPGSIANGRYTFAGSTQPRIRPKGKGVSADVNWKPGGDITVRSITAYRKVDVFSQADVDRTNQPQASVQISQYEKDVSQEFNISGPEDQTLSWLVGAYYFHSTAGNPYFRYSAGDSPGGTPLVEYTNSVTSEGISGFGELTLRATDKLHLTGGIRVNSESKRFQYRDIVNLFGPSQSTDAHRHWNDVVYRLVSRYELSDDANVYASFSTGFKSGVYNSYTYLDAPVDPEKIKALEVGAKAKVGPMTLSAAAFAYNYDDLQVSAYTTVNGVSLVTLSNAASAKIRGLELSADGEIAPGLSLSAGVSWQPVGKYGDYPNAQVTRPIPGATGPVVAEVIVPYDASGSRMIRSPKITSNVRLSYGTELRGGRFNGTVNAYYNSGFYWQTGNLTREDDYLVVNARLSWTHPTAGLTFSIWGNNLTDEVYSVDRNAQVLGGDSISLPPKREFGVGVSYAF